MNPNPPWLFWLRLIVCWWVAFAFLFVGSWELYRNYVFAHYSKPTVGMVERKYQTVRQDKNGTHDVWHLAYRYQVGPRPTHSESTVQSDTYAGVSEGSSLPLRYLPDDPTVNRVDLPEENQEAGSLVLVSMGGGVFLAVLGAYILRQRLRRNQSNLNFGPLAR